MKEWRADIDLKTLLSFPHFLFRDLPKTILYLGYQLLQLPLDLQPRGLALYLDAFTLARESAFDLEPYLPAAL